ncbi:MAG: hypothetical protein DCF22_01970 [Leptolyngbya sp.]|nr:MAG: hypothetical protein DCF22_01970 [Leptolyngbya sp.]
MRPTDPIILVIYLVAIAWALSNIVNSFNDEYTVSLDEDTLKQQLATQNLQDIVGIGFDFDKRYEFGKDDKLKQFGVKVTNKSQSHSIFIDWDYCATTDLQGRSRRVTRLVPGTTLDLFQNQVFSTVASGATLKEIITAEDVLKRKEPSDKDTAVALEMEVSKPLLDFEALKKSKDAPPQKKYARFIAGIDPLEFSLDLALRLIGSTYSAGGDRIQLRCKFILKKLPWYAGLPWNPK